MQLQNFEECLFFFTYITYTKWIRIKRIFFKQLEKYALPSDSLSIYIL